MTSPVQDIVERLRSSASRLDYAGDGLGYYTRADAIREREAAATISRLTADNEALRKENDGLLESLTRKVNEKIAAEAECERLAKERDEAPSDWGKAAASGIADFKRAEAAEARADKAAEDMRSAYEGVTHALMVLPVPERSDQKRAYGSLVDAKQTLDSAIRSLPTESKDA